MILSGDCGPGSSLMAGTSAADPGRLTDCLASRPAHWRFWIVTESFTSPVLVVYPGADLNSVKPKPCRRVVSGQPAALSAQGSCVHWPPLECSQDTVGPVSGLCPWPGHAKVPLGSLLGPSVHSWN